MVPPGRASTGSAPGGQPPLAARRSLGDLGLPWLLEVRPRQPELLYADLARRQKLYLTMLLLVMALLGLPFSFSMGRRGAFFGITASVAIAISYWGIFSVFEQLGAYGMLIPILAAWAPNILFSAAGLLILLTIRT